jgi:GR25 family glycosyltransferase involved in LPS biosynthesis
MQVYLRAAMDSTKTKDVWIERIRSLLTPTEDEKQPFWRLRVNHPVIEPDIIAFSDHISVVSPLGPQEQGLAKIDTKLMWPLSSKDAESKDTKKDIIRGVVESLVWDRVLVPKLTRKVFLLRKQGESAQALQKLKEFSQDPRTNRYVGFKSLTSNNKESKQEKQKYVNADIDLMEAWISTSMDLSAENRELYSSLLWDLVGSHPRTASLPWINRLLQTIVPNCMKQPLGLKTICLNLKNRYDRQLSMTASGIVHLFEPTKFNFVEAVDGREYVKMSETPPNSSTPDASTIKNPLMDEVFRKFQVSPGAKGCAASHVKAWSDLSESEKDEPLLIMEDDGFTSTTTFRDLGLLNKLLLDKKDFVTECDLIWVGYHMPPTMDKFNAMFDTQPRRLCLGTPQNSVGGTFAYLVTGKRGAQKLLSAFKSMPSTNLGVDTWMIYLKIKQMYLDKPIFFSRYYINDDKTTHDSDCGFQTRPAAAPLL